MARPFDKKDVVILGHIYGYSFALTRLAYLHPDPVIVTAVCTAVPALLTLTHWFLIKDDKVADA